jgi:period circadian protein
MVERITFVDVETQKELLKTLKELKLLLPAEKRSKGSTSSTLNTLKYALRCVKQVEGERPLRR